MRTTSRRRRQLITCCGLVLAAAASAGCSDDSDGATTTTTAPPTTEGSPVTSGGSSSPPTTDVATTIAEPTTVPTTVTPTTVASTTTNPDPEAIKAEVAKAYRRTSSQTVAMVRDPRLKNLEARLSVPMVRNSPIYKELERNVRDLVKKGERIALPAKNPVYKVTVENVELLGDAPYQDATVTTCTAINQERVRMSDGEIVGPPAGLRAFREEHTMRLTRAGWKRFADADQALGVWEGSDECEER